MLFARRLIIYTKTQMLSLSVQNKDIFVF